MMNGLLVKLLIESNNKQFRSVKELQTSRRKSVAVRTGGGRYLSQSYEDGMRKKLSIICVKVVV